MSTLYEKLGVHDYTAELLVPQLEDVLDKLERHSGKKLTVTVSEPLPADLSQWTEHPQAPIVHGEEVPADIAPADHADQETDK